MTDRLVSLEQRLEGVRLTAYRCPAGVWIIGSGHTSAAGAPHVDPGLTISAEETDAILGRDLANVRARVLAICAKVPNGLTSGETDALTSFVFNLDEAHFRDNTALRRLLRGDRRGAADAMLLWTKATIDGQLITVSGLVKRRRVERLLFLSGHDAAAAQADQEFGAMPQAVAKPKLRKRVYKSTTAHAATGMGAGGALFACEGATHAVSVMSDAKSHATEAATLFGMPEGDAVLVGGGFLILVGAAFVIWKRYRRSLEDILIEFTDGIHLPFVGDLLGREETTVEAEVTHVATEVETEAGTIRTEATHVAATVETAVESVIAGAASIAVPPAEEVEAVAVEQAHAVLADAAAATAPATAPRRCRSARRSLRRRPPAVRWHRPPRRWVGLVRGLADAPAPHPYRPLPRHDVPRRRPRLLDRGQGRVARPSQSDVAADLGIARRQVRR